MNRAFCARGSCASSSSRASAADLAMPCPTITQSNSVCASAVRASCAVDAVVMSSPRSRAAVRSRLDVEGAGEANRQRERERAALRDGARDVDLAAQRVGELAADRKPQPRATVLPTGGAVRLLEGLEDDLQLLGSDADA